LFRHGAGACVDVICYAICVSCISQDICYYVYTGTAACCNYQCLYSITDTLGTATILDPSGCLNWLAIAYN
jgi:hypothetical protein